MKKILLSFTISAAFFTSSFTYAANNDPSLKAKQAFTSQFAQVKNVEWTIMSNAGVYQAAFTFNNEPLQAFFSEEGEFLGTTRQITKSQLPILVISELDKQYADARVVSIFEYSKKDGLYYYITLTNGKGGSVIKATGNGELSVYKKNLK